MHASERLDRLEGLAQAAKPVRIALGRMQPQPSKVRPAHAVVGELLAGLEPQQLHGNPAFHPRSEFAKSSGDEKTALRQSSNSTSPVAPAPRWF